jgi:hypothetical protein
MLRKMLFTGFLAVVLSAVCVSASQLATPAFAGTACGSPCTSSTICVRPCLCYIGVAGGTTGVCQPEGPPPAPADTVSVNLAR